ncbi:MAG: NADH-quinone oxidoreductase subunit NuoG [Enterobacteriaceae bacterium]|nr:NADH-quinone oxidoreductase subunit NuoG [Enterobacteriaceae bacterium]
MATIHVDGKEYEVDGAENLLQACLSLGLDIPYFCWHPALGSVGSCRQCAVKQFQGPDDKRGRLVMSCMTPASDGSYIAIEDEEAKKFRAAVVEFLMVNHPHDCPVCEEGGNCHLQDMTVMTGHSFRKYRFNKRTHNNQELGPFINHEMNRCIACYRCVRYYKDYAGGDDFGVYGAHDNVYFGRPEDGTLENEFSGNLVEVCPTGVFTDKTHSERYNRKWDMQFAPSICQQCSVGCNTSPGERYGELRRIENRYNGTVNHYFLCDRGRFGYGYVNLKDRPRTPSQLRGQDRITLNPEQAMQGAADILRQSKKVIGIGSPRASLESNFALRQLVGADNFSTGMSSGELARVQLMQQVLRDSGLYTPSLREMESYDAVLVLGEDVTQTGARIALALRQAVKGKARELAGAQRVADWQIAAVQNIGQHAKYPLFVTNVDKTRLDDVAAWNYSAAVEDQARLGFAIAHAIDNSAPAVTDLPAELNAKVDIIAQALSGARKPLIVTGSNAGSEAIIQAATNVALALKKQGLETGITFVAAEANSMGIAMIGGNAIEEALSELESGAADTLIVMENDLYRHAAKSRIDAVLAKVENLVVLDHQHTELMDKATIILSAASFAESDGTLVSQEGRAQRFFQVYEPSFYDKDPNKKTYILESWRWLHSLDSVYNSRRIDWTQLDHVISAVAEEFPHLAGIVAAAPDASFRIKGLKLAREPHRYSGRTAMMADVSVHEKRQPQDNDTAFAYSMEGYSAPEADRQQIPFAWTPGWNSPQAWNKFQSEVGGHLRFGDPGVRLIDPLENASFAYFDANTIFAENSTSNDENGWYVAPYYHLFGSDELSQRSAVIQQRMPQAYVMLNPQDAAKLSVSVGSLLSFICAGSELTLPVAISETLGQGQIGLPLGFPHISPALLGERVENLREATL